MMSIFRLVESGWSLKLSERLEQGVVERGRVFNLWNMAEPGQERQRRLRQQGLEITGLFRWRHGVHIAPQDRDGGLHARVGGAVGASRLAVGADEIIQPVGEI